MLIYDIVARLILHLAKKLCVVRPSQFLGPHEGLSKLCMNTIVSKEDRTQAISTKMAKTATTTITGMKQS